MLAYGRVRVFSNLVTIYQSVDFWCVLHVFRSGTVSKWGFFYSCHGILHVL